MSAAERFERPLDDGIEGRCRQCQDWLQQQIQLAARKRRIAIGAAATVVLVSIGISIPFLIDWMHQRDLVSQLAKLESSRKVAETQDLLAQAPERLKTKPGTAEAITTAHDFIAHETEFKRAFDLSMQAIGADNYNIAQDSARRLQAERELAQLAPEFQTDAKNALQAWDKKCQIVRNASLTAQLDSAESVAAALDGTNGVEAVHAALARLDSMQAAMLPWQKEPPELDHDLSNRIHRLSSRAAVWAANEAGWEKARTALQNAQSLDEYLEDLDRLVQSPFATVAQREAADEIDRLKINQKTLLGELLKPDERAAWDSLTNAAGWRTSLMPEQPTAREKDLYFKLRDDKNMQNVYVYQLVTNARPRNIFQTHLVFVQGLLVPDRTGQMAGLVYDPGVFQDTSRFVPMTYSDWDYASIIKSNRTPECEIFERLGLGDLIDPNTGNYQKPVLQLLDQLNRDDNSSSLFRAFVTMKLFALAGLRPDEWALSWSHVAMRNLQALKDLGALDLKSGDWMVRALVAKYEASFQKFFERARGIPLEKQAMLLVQLTQAACQTDFSYAGFIDVDGRPVLRRMNAPVPEYWGWNSGSESAVLLLHRPAGATGLVKTTEPLPFTPVFIFNGDRRQLLEQKARDISYPAGRAAEILPPLFSGLHE